MTATFSAPSASSGVSASGLMPPDDSRWVSSLLLALVAHALLAAALTWGVRWNRAPTEPVVAQAELWSRLPQSAAPQPVEQATPQPPPAQPEVPRPAPQAAKQALDAQRDADIALRQQKKLEDKKRVEDENRLQLEAQKKKQLQEKEDKAEAQKKALDNERQKALDQQAKTARAKAAQASAEKADAAELAKERAENLKRIAGLAGATGSAGSTGTALKSSGPSATYAGRIVGAVRPNIVFTDTPVGNPEADVEVRTLPDGSIASRRLLKSSGNPAWDDAVLKALDRTARLPKDEEGRVPALLVIGFRPRD